MPDTDKIDRRFDAVHSRVTEVTERVARIETDIGYLRPVLDSLKMVEQNTTVMAKESVETRRTVERLENTVGAMKLELTGFKSVAEPEINAMKGLRKKLALIGLAALLVGGGGGVGVASIAKAICAPEHSGK